MLAAFVVGVLAFVPCCSTTASLPEGQSYLRTNSITVHDTPDVPSSELMPYIKQKAPAFNLFGGQKIVLNSNSISTSEQNIKDHLDYLGYYDSSVESSVKVKRKRAYVHYDVYPGHRIPITGITYDVPSGEFAEDFYADTLNVTVRPGGFLSERDLEAESERSAAYLRTQGYYGFSKQHYFFEADTLQQPGSALLKMSVREYTRSGSPRSAKPLKKSYIGDVTITHDADLPLRESVLQGLNIIRPGIMYDERLINTSYNRLASLSVFNSVGVTLSQADSTTVDCDIVLTESKVQGAEVDLEVSTNSSGLMGISPQLKYHHKNIFHGGEILNLSFLGNFQFKFNDPTRSTELGVTAGIVFPKFLGLPYSRFKGSSLPRTELNISYSYQDRPEYMRNIFSTNFGYTGIMGEHWRYQVYPLQLNMVVLHNLDDSFAEILRHNPFMRYSYQDHFDAGAGGTLYYSSATTLNPRSTYWYTRLSLDLSGNILSAFKSLMPRNADGAGKLFGAPFTQYVRGEWTIAKTWRWGEEQDNALAARFVAGVGYAYGNSSSIPFEKQFYVGGANSMRGWQARELGPGSSPINKTFSIPSQTGDMRLEANLEYRRRLFWKIEGAAFVDVGNVWTLLDNGDETGRFDRNFYKTIAADWGLGIRADLNFLVLRVDVGFKVRDPQNGGSWIGPGRWLKSHGSSLHFGVGYPF